ncbi:hypothetical protein [Mesorhizobium japonicum]|uniref:hypothetical protein n=1 Tax=Mesorhizobium japonicum TaxID=2066070 RepID=UPI001FCAA538|nr:hypothetical protein [Mesorhizobium japonicum]
MARAMSANASSCSAWPTPDAFVSNDGELPATWLSRQALEKSKGKNGNGMGLPLAMAAKLWPTPAALDGQKAPKTFAGGNISLPEAAKTWSTPRASDGEKGGPKQAFGAGGMPLAAQTLQWRTPRSSESGQYQYDRGDKSKPTPTLTGQAFSHLGQPTSKPGETCLVERRSLNPLFVEWLMGWPPGWTASECSATALSVWKRHMRCALSQLASPAKAPPAQLSLFA